MKQKSRVSFLSRLLITLVIVGMTTSGVVTADICIPKTFVVTLISGKVITNFDQKEEPLTNMVITLKRGGDDGPVIATQTVKEDGSFNFKVKPGWYMLKVSGPALPNFYLKVRVRSSKAAKDQKEIVVMMDADDKKPCMGCTAELRDKKNN